MASKDEVPRHIQLSIYAHIQEKLPYSEIAKRYGISKGTITNIKSRLEKEFGTAPEKKPPSKNELKRRANIGKAAVTVRAFQRAEFIAEGFINAFDVIAYNAQHLVEVIDHSKTAADEVKERQESILENFKKYAELSPEQKIEMIGAIGNSIQKINEFFTRDMIRIKAVGEMRKQLETFLKMKQEITDIQTIKNIIDAFFKAADELDDATYKQFRDKVVEYAPITSRLFASAEQAKQGLGDDGNKDQQEQ